jgi:predicted secreted protein
MVGMAYAPPLIRDYFVSPKLRLETNLSPLALNQESYFPTRIVESSPMSPKTLRSHKTTTMITTAFKIILMEPAIGMYELTSQRRTPTTIKVSTTWIKGMIYSFFVWILERYAALSANSLPWSQALNVRLKIITKEEYIKL